MNTDNTIRQGYENSAHLYDLFDSKPNITFFGQYADRGDEILDIGAGTGRIALPLARRGVKVWAIEPSPAMRREFEIKLRDEPDLRERIKLIVGDAQSFALRRTFPVALLSGSFDHLLDDKARLVTLSNIGQHLIPGGRLVFDVFLGLMKDSLLSPAGVVREGTREVRRFVGGQLLPEQRKETHLVFEVYENGVLIERVEERSLVGLTNRTTVHRLLNCAGFSLQHEWSSYDRAPFHDGDALLIVEAVQNRGEERKER